MSRFLLSLILPLILMAGSALLAQQHVLTNYSLEEGLPQSSVLVNYQDADGNIWFGTQGGVSKFNGHEFVNYDSRHGLAGNHLTAIWQDRTGRYWFGHRYKGITLMSRNKFTVIDLTDHRVNCIKEDNNRRCTVDLCKLGLNNFD